jgi:hypothetical protein
MISAYRVEFNFYFLMCVGGWILLQWMLEKNRIERRGLDFSG